MHYRSFSRTPLAVLALGGLIAALPAQAQQLYLAVNNGEVREVSRDGTNLGTFAANGPNGHLYSPIYLDFAPSGNLLVIDSPKIGISQFSPTGVFLGSFGAGTPLRYSAVAADTFGNVFAADPYRHEVDKFSSTGVSLGTFADANKGITTPQGLAFDKAGNLYVSNSVRDGNTFNFINSINKYAPDGTSLGVFSTPFTDAGYQAQTIAFDNAGDLFVGGFSGRSGTIVKISSTGVNQGYFLKNYGIYDPLQFAFDSADNLFIDDNGGAIFQYNSKGIFQGRLNKVDVAVTGLAFAPPAPTAAAVPEASTTVSLGLMLLFGMGGLIVSRRKRRLQ
jgi:hypothetical protein